MSWVTLLTTDNVEHTINMETIVQIVSQLGGQAGATRQPRKVSHRRFRMEHQAARANPALRGVS